MEEAAVHSCIPCLLAFADRNEQKEHLKSDLHTYNLKRRLVDLRPIAPAEYLRKLELLQDAFLPNKKTHPKSSKSKKNRKPVHAQSLSPIKDIPPTRSDQAAAPPSSSANAALTDIPEERNANDHQQYLSVLSLFDRHSARTFQKNIGYMERHFSFYVPDSNYVKNLEDFVTYLGRKVYEGHQCLYCNKPFKSLEACQMHMNDRGHRRIGRHLPEHEDEYEEFYDYSTSYKELNLPDTLMNALLDEDEWEVIDEEVTGDEGEMVVVDATENKRLAVSNLTWQERFERLGIHQAYVNESDNLVLPDDRVIPHRKYVRNGKLILHKRTETTTKKHALLLTNKAHYDKKGLAANEERQGLRDKQKSKMRLGVKSNRLYRYIARKNKIFI